MFPSCERCTHSHRSSTRKGGQVVTQKLMLVTSSLFLALCGLAGSASAGGPDLPAREKFHLFLLAGQSNMAGRGKVEAQDKIAHPRVLTLNKQREWVPAVDPIHFDKPVAGVGLGRAFAMAIAKTDPSIVVGLIPCAAGGSPISSWEPGGYHSQTKSHPYDDAIARAKHATKQGTLKAILWHQGESDCTPEKAGLYEKKLDLLIGRFRQDLGTPDLPFLVGQMGQFPERPWDQWAKIVDAAHQSLPDEVRRTAFVPASGLTCRSDKVHFDARSLREFGKRYAHVYLSLPSASR